MRPRAVGRAGGRACPARSLAARRAIRRSVVGRIRAGAPRPCPSRRADIRRAQIALGSGGGNLIRVIEFAPASGGGRRSPMHRTRTVDYGIVLKGEIILILSDSEVLLRAGDVVIQRGTDHAWENRSAAGEDGLRTDRRRADEACRWPGDHAVTAREHKVSSARRSGRCSCCSWSTCVNVGDRTLLGVVTEPCAPRSRAVRHADVARQRVSVRAVQPGRRAGHRPRCRPRKPQAHPCAGRRRLVDRHRSTGPAQDFLGLRCARGGRHRRGDRLSRRRCR